jgi:hypothetical protein
MSMQYEYEFTSILQARTLKQRTMPSASSSRNLKYEKTFDLCRQVVHNYGHGGYGVTSAPGTAKHAIKLVRQLQLSANRHSKL